MRASWSFSMVSSYFQAVILQKAGQRIISDLREDLFTHIESLAHEQLNEIPVGKLVTRVTNDTNAISMMFTNLLVNLAKKLFCDPGHPGGHAAGQLLRADPDGAVLCALHRAVYGDLPQIFPGVPTAVSRTAPPTSTPTCPRTSRASRSPRSLAGRAPGWRTSAAAARRWARPSGTRSSSFGVFRPLVYMLYVSSVLCLFYLGGMGYLDGHSFLGQTISGGTIVTFYMYISKFYNPIQNLAEQFNWLQSAMASSEKVFSILDLEPRMVDAPRPPSSCLRSGARSSSGTSGSATCPASGC